MGTFLQIRWAECIRKTRTIIDRLIYILIDWLTDWLMDWLIDWLINCFDRLWVHQLTDGLTYWFVVLTDQLLWSVDWLINWLKSWLVGWVISHQILFIECLHMVDWWISYLYPALYTVLLSLPQSLPQEEEGGEGASTGWRGAGWRGHGDGEDSGAGTAGQESLTHQLQVKSTGTWSRLDHRLWVYM